MDDVDVVDDDDDDDDDDFDDDDVNDDNGVDDEDVDKDVDDVAKKPKFRLVIKHRVSTRRGACYGDIGFRKRECQ